MNVTLSHNQMVTLIINNKMYVAIGGAKNDFAVYVGHPNQLPINVAAFGDKVYAQQARQLFPYITNTYRL